jgi:hypothetical protein
VNGMTGGVTREDVIRRLLSVKKYVRGLERLGLAWMPLLSLRPN